ncbi:glycosyltransferase family 2 protein [Agrobacterium tumefaciens]|uniref:glycosyltransferase family 2 protein n=1 Tax=Agrobacterium tumefaciens TaxID=358 RepID=UPI001574C5CF|nr:glycosyltransferase family 2 protein [Agrobacterium tumefaciens]NTE58915.1 glycosyltransferase family 2 protein [Agrobacterium tumefaciens]NTE72513.1 glycosyltransferase family 2 protein [Agrobacterium tumefaciens]
MENLAPSPDISFVIAAYNAADTIEAAVESALGQQGVTLEVIVVDDRSADDTIALVEGIAVIDPRVRLLALAENLGPGGARNAGIEAATGRWIAVLDSDDVIRPERSACMMCRAEAASAAIAVDNLDVVYTDGRPMETMFPEEFLGERPVLTLEDFISSNILFRATFNFGYMKPMFRRDFLNAEGLRFREDIRIGEDYILLASALAAGGLCVIEPKPGYIYNIREGSISRVLELHHVEAMMRADQEFLSHYTLLPAAMDAQQARSRSLRLAHNFLTLVENIKRRSVLGALKTTIRDPAVLGHLRMPIAVRLRRLRDAMFAPAANTGVKRQIS